jgi:competence protein ComEC
MWVAQGSSPEHTGPGSGRESRSERKRQQPALTIAPLVPLVAAVATGIVADRYGEPCQTKAWMMIALACGVIAMLTVRRALISSLAVMAAVCAIGGAWHHFRWSDMAPDDLAWSITETPRPAWVRGVVRENLGLRRSQGFGFGTNQSERLTTRFVLEFKAISDGKRWHPASGRAIVIVSGDRRDVPAGCMVEAAGQLAKAARPLNPGEFDYRAYLQAQGIRLRLTVDEPESLWRDPDGTGDVLAGWLGSLKEWSHTRLVERLDSSIAPLAAALLLGRREEVEPEVNDAFARTGTTHLLAISGLQLQALAAALLLLFRVVGFPRRPSYLAVGLLMFGYALLVGLAPSVVRSTVMTATFCLAAIANRMARPANTLALAALATLGINPSFLFDIGCQLSFLAIGAIVWLVPPACMLAREFPEMIRRWIRGPRSPLDELERRLKVEERVKSWWRARLHWAVGTLVNGVVGSTVIWLAALPLVASRFHIVSSIGILLNIPLIPLTSAALLLSGLGLVLSAIWAPLGGLPAWGAGWLLKITEAIVFWGVAQPWGHRFVVGPGWEWVLIFYVLLGLAAVSATVASISRSSWLTGSLVWWLLALWAVPGWWLSDIASKTTTPEVEFLAVGHGLAVVIQTPGGQTILYDCGALGDPSIGRRIIAPALWTRGVTRIDTVLLSHADQDHYDGLADLLDRFVIGVVRVPPGFAGASNPGAIKLIDQVRARGIRVQPTTAPETWESAGVRFNVQHPPAGWHPETSDNARSLVLDVTFAGRHIVLTGDLEQQGLLELVARPSPEPPPDVFLSPHHGGKTANPEWLYRWAKPRLVVVSQRAVPPRTNDALALLEKQGIPLLRTWLQGSIRFQWARDRIVAHQFLEEQNLREFKSYWSFVIRWESILRWLAGFVGFAIGAIACVVLAVVEFGAWTLVVPRRSIEGEDDRADELAALAEPIAVRARDGARLAGRWIPVPAPGEAGRTVLLLHGFGERSSALESRRVATFHRHGWNVASLDSRGYGLSDGPYSSFGGREADDIRAWLDMLAEHLARIDPSLPFRPTVWGRSMGAAIALRAAAQDSRIVALVLESPMVDLDASVAVVLRKKWLPFPEILARLVTRRAAKLAGVSLSRPRPIDFARRVNCPTLIVHGTEDRLVLIAEARRLADAFPTPPRWFDVAGAGHTNVIDKGAEPLFEQIAAFLDEATRSAEPTGSETSGEL